MSFRPLRSLFFLVSVLGGAASVFSVACADDDPVDPVPDPTPDATFDSPNVKPDANLPPTDAGRNPDARGAYNPTERSVVCDGSPCATQITAGREHFCARMNDGTVRCWGSDAFGILGRTPGQTPDAGDGGTTTAVIPGLENVAQVSAGARTNCARMDDGSVKCWGHNSEAQLGLRADRPASDSRPHPTPSIVTLESAAARVDVGQAYACASLASGKLWCWGRDEHVQLLRPGGTTEADPLRKREPGIAAVEPLVLKELAMSDNTVLALSSQGQVWTWGALGGDDGIISGRVGSVTPNPTPKRIETLEKVSTVVASTVLSVYPQRARGHACALVEGEIYCWGRSYAGATGTGVTGEAREPSLAPFPDTVKTWPQQLAAGDEITCARMTDGSIYCCGSDIHGRLGTGSKIELTALFTKASAFTHRAVQVVTSDTAVCALVEDGSVECWGSNEKGELGLPPDKEDHPSPVKVAF